MIKAVFNLYNNGVQGNKVDQKEVTKINSTLIENQGLPEFSALIEQQKVHQFF